jgi:hypothetical protein
LIDLLASGQLAGCTQLTLWDNRLGDRAAEALARCEDLNELRVLDLGWNQIGPEGAQALATSRVLAQLERLNLYHNDIRDAGVAALAGSGHLQPADLNLCRNGVGLAGALALRASPAMRRLRRLACGCNDLGDAGVAALAELTHVEYLNVRMNGIGPRGAEALAVRRADAPLRLLGIEDNPLGDEGLCALAASGLLAAAEVANLLSVEITADGLRCAATYPRRTPGRLRLGLNALGDIGVEALLSGPALAGLVELSLPCNDIGPRGARALAASPLLRGLARLDLVGNDLGPAGRSALADSPYLPPGALHIDAAPAHQDELPGRSA